MAQHTVSALTVEGTDPDPWVQVDRWLIDGGGSEPAQLPVMVFATAGADGIPDARLIQIRSFDSDGLSFYSSQRSGTGRQLGSNGFGATVIYWPELARQMRIRGPVAALPRADCDAEFASRSRISQLGAWANVQSEPIADRAALKRQVAEVERRFPRAVPRPDHWLVYVLDPEVIELWQYGQEHLHDRVEYRKASAGSWARQRLQP